MKHRFLNKLNLSLMTLGGFLVAGTFSQSLLAAPVTLTWEASKDSEVVGYRIHYGFATGDYRYSLDVGNVTSLTLSSLSEDQIYYFAATAYTRSGLESDLSVEISKLPLADTDSDGVLDQMELRYGTNPDNADTDGDGLSDGEELKLGTNPNSIDSDNDGISDSEEMAYWGSKYADDFDGDGIINLLDRDSDNDGFSDGYERKLQSNPSDKASAPLPSYKFVTGLGSFPENGGWVEVTTVGDRRGVASPNLDPVSLWVQMQWPEYTLANGETRVASGDIDGDGANEVIIGLGPVPGNPAVPGGYFQVLDDDNSHLTWGQVSWKEYNAKNGETRPACADLNGDGKAEILIGLGPGGAGSVAIFEFSDRKLKETSWVRLEWDEYSQVNGETRPSGADLDGDGKDEIVVGLGSTVKATGFPQGFFEVFDDNLKHLAWGQVPWDEYNEVNGESWPSAGDLDGDGVDELVIGLGRGSGGSFAVMHYENGKVPHLAWRDIEWADYESVFEEVRPTTGNIDQDGQDEIVVGMGLGGGGWLQAFDDAGTSFAFLGSRKLAFPEYVQSVGETWPSYSLGARSSCFGDFDNDGDVDNSDLSTFKTQLGSTGCEGPCEGDYDGNSRVDDFDFKAFESNLGRKDCAVPAS